MSFVPLTLEEARRHVGERVTFHYFHGEEVIGTITSVGAKNVFVRFNPRHDYGEACDPERLSLGER
jgi:FKBP-type peptidyl-prolyl cis-trans isomerase 2